MDKKDWEWTLRHSAYRYLGIFFSCEMWTKLRERILEEIVPGEDERRRVEEFGSRIVEVLNEKIRDAGFDAVAELHGSVARDTWLRGTRDFDVFVILNSSYERSVFPRVLGVVKGFVGEDWVEAYAEHPYVRAEVDGFNVEFVPCFRVDPSRGIISATDRTPVHTAYVKEHLKVEARDEVRLLKQFMKGVEVYGAELKVGGFSGYLCELLIIHYGSFDKLLEESRSWEFGEVLGLAGGDDVDVLRKRFKDPMILVDPVDSKRNVASPVSDTVFWGFVAAARAFVKDPGERFFFVKDDPVDEDTLIGELRDRASSLIFVEILDENVDVPDMLWGQIYKTEKAIAKSLVKAGFRVLRSSSWSDEVSKHVLVFELESEILPDVVKRIGPPVAMAGNSEKFVEKHLGSEETVSGPWVEGDRWWVETRRRDTDVKGFVSSVLKDGGSKIGVSKRLGKKMMRKSSVLLDDEIEGHLGDGFAVFLARFLKGRPGWLE